MMDTNNKKLLRRPKPRSDESFLGYIIRLAQENGYEDADWLLQKANIKNTSGYFFLFSSDTNFEVLAQLVGLQTQKLVELSYPWPVGDPDENARIVLNQRMPISMICPTPNKICPKCLCEADYVRKIWDVIIVTACSVHSCLLVDKCPSCQQSIAFPRNNVSICECGFDWKTINLTTLKTSHLQFAKFTYKSFNLPTGFFTADNYNNFLSVNFYIFSLIILIQAGLMDSSNKNSVSINLDISNLHELLNDTFVKFKTHSFWLEK